MSSSAQQEADIYWAEVVAEATADVAAESAQRATSAAEAYEGARGARLGGRGGGGRQQLTRPGECDFDAWLDSRLAEAAAASMSRVAATMARRAATLTAASAPAVKAAAEGLDGAETSRLQREEQRGRPAGGNGGERRKPTLSMHLNVDVGAWNWADVGVGGGAWMADGGREIDVFLKEGREVRKGTEEKNLTEEVGVGSQEWCPLGGAATVGTPGMLR